MFARFCAAMASLSAHGLCTFRSVWIPSALCVDHKSTYSVWESFDECRVTQAQSMVIQRLDKIRTCLVYSTQILQVVDFDGSRVLISLGTVPCRPPERLKYMKK